jgi:hypothetical protein
MSKFNQIYIIYKINYNNYEFYKKIINNYINNNVKIKFKKLKFYI